MRVHLGGNNNVELFSQHLLKIGDGTFQNDEESMININSIFVILVRDQNNLSTKFIPKFLIFKINLMNSSVNVQFLSPKTTPSTS